MSAEWQTEATDAVARVLHQAGVALSPAGVAANLELFLDDPPDEDAVRAALDGLHDQRMVRRLDRDGEFYRVTDRGRDYVETEVDQEGVGFVE